MLKLSLIIPVYNEERHIGACLDAIKAQTDMPDEVILVNNNCSDRTLEIAKKYDFVSVVGEPQQGRGHARTKGFNSAKYEIIGRIDADSVLSSDWVERVRRRFSEDSELAGITGMAWTSIIPGINSIKSKVPTRTYYWFAHAGFRTITMWGANMAISREYWQKVKEDVCLDDSIVHEDQDVSLWVAALGGKIVQDNKLIMTTNGQTYRYLPKLLHYTRLYESTKSFHRKNGNLSSAKLRKVSFIRTLPGRLFALSFAIYMLIIALLFFPIDFYIAKRHKNSTWLD